VTARGVAHRLDRLADHFTDAGDDYTAHAIAEIARDVRELVDPPRFLADDPRTPRVPVRFPPHDPPDPDFWQYRHKPGETG
jgi:hypothetical protein